MGAIPDNDGLHKRRGIWHFRLRVSGRYSELSTRTTNYQEARKVRQQVTQAASQNQLPTDLSRSLFNKVAEDWLAARRSLVAAKTYTWYEERLATLLKSFGGRRLEELTANGGELLRAYQVRVAARTVNNELGIVRLILKSVRLWRLVEDDARPLRTRKSTVGRSLTPGEESRLWSAARSRPEWAVAFHCALVAANTTCRSCEIRGLQLRDVNLDGREIVIRRTSTKTDAGARRIPLNSTAHSALSQLVARAARLGSHLPTHHLLPRKLADRTYDVNQPQLGWRSAWRRMTRAAGLHGLSFHDLRHHCITKLAEAGVPEQTLMSIAGHVSRQMLEHTLMLEWRPDGTRWSGCARAFERTCRRGRMSEHTKRATQQIWDALGASIFKGPIIERIEAVLIQDLVDLEKAVSSLGAHHPPYAEAGQRSAYSRGYQDAIGAALALVQGRLR